MVLNLETSGYIIPMSFWIYLTLKVKREVEIHRNKELVSQKHTLISLD